MPSHLAERKSAHMTWSFTRQTSLLKMIIAANSYDLAMVAIYAWAGMAAKYLGPYTLKRILYVY